MRKFLGESYERAITEIERLRAHIDLLALERQKLLNEKNASERELAFTKAELVKFQRDHQHMVLQVRVPIFYLYQY